MIYANYVLDNWALIDPDGPIALGNIRMVQKFLGGRDEAWFVLVHVAIEAKAGGVLALFPDILKAASEKDSGSLEMLFSLMNRLWDDINAIFDRMPESCDPYIYFNRVRPYIHGWKDNPALPDGIIYEGVAETGGRPQAFRGQTGSQSSIVPSMDALFGIGHEDDPLKAFLDDLHAYRPVSNRNFIDAVRAASNLRETVKALGGSVLIEGYNANVRQVARFRTRHLEYAASYIHKQAKDSAGNDTDVGHRRHAFHEISEEAPGRVGKAPSAQWVENMLGRACESALSRHSFIVRRTNRAALPFESTLPWTPKSRTKPPFHYPLAGSNSFP